MTLHRPTNVDDVNAFSEIAGALTEISQEIPLVFPVHPRTRQRVEVFGVDLGAIKVAEPLAYLDFLGLIAKASLVLTDSGGIQEETTALSVPCVTLRLNTERPVTLELGTNRIGGIEKSSIVTAAREALSQNGANHIVPPLWDGQAATRIVAVIERSLSFSDSSGNLS